jgi:hypothetical protein
MREYKELKLFEIEKVFSRNNNEISEYYSMA